MLTAPSVPNCIKCVFPPLVTQAARQEVTLRPAFPEICSLKSLVIWPLRCDLSFSQVFWLDLACRRMNAFSVFYKRPTTSELAVGSIRPESPGAGQCGCRTGVGATLPLRAGGQATKRFEVLLGTADTGELLAFEV